MSHQATDAPLLLPAWPGPAVPSVCGVATSCLAAGGGVMDAVGWQWGLQDESKPGRLVVLSYSIMPSQMAPWVDIEGWSLEQRENTNMCLPGHAGDSFPACRWMSTFPLSFIAGCCWPWLSSMRQSW